MSTIPKVYDANTIKSKILKPAQTSIYQVYIPNVPFRNSGFYSNRSIKYDSTLITLSCAEATLPGSSLATSDMTDKYHGSTHRYGYRRQYDDRADFTFYVDAPKDGGAGYDIIWFFEQWISYIVGEDSLGGQQLENYSYRVNYPITYRSSIYITKFEKDVNLVNLGNASKQQSSFLRYTFVNAFPISITSMPVSYEQSQILKCTVSFTYVRYIAERGRGSSTDASSMRNQASRNAAALNVGQPTAPGVPAPPGSFDTPK